MLFVEREYNGNFEEILDSLLFHLKNGGYVVVADIDIKSILRKALGYDFKNYHILEICKPQAALELIGGDDLNGLFLPCKVVALESQGKTLVRMVRSSEISGKFEMGNSAKMRNYEDELAALMSSFNFQPP